MTRMMEARWVGVELHVSDIECDVVYNTAAGVISVCRVARAGGGVVGAPVLFRSARLAGVRWPGAAALEGDRGGAVVGRGVSREGICFFFSSRRRHTRFKCDWSSDVCSSD